MRTLLYFVVEGIMWGSLLGMLLGILPFGIFSLPDFQLFAKFLLHGLLVGTSAGILCGITVGIIAGVVSRSDMTGVRALAFVSGIIAGVISFVTIARYGYRAPFIDDYLPILSMSCAAGLWTGIVAVFIVRNIFIAYFEKQLEEFDLTV
ncbi:MAG: hypothetical protein AAFR22_15150 [Chloroflexota bacterium]